MSIILQYLLKVTWNIFYFQQMFHWFVGKMGNNHDYLTEICTLQFYRHDEFIVSVTEHMRM